MENRPKVGVGVAIVRRDGGYAAGANGSAGATGAVQARVLLGKRKNAHGEGTWSFPGGHLEFGESFEECARREVLEETGLSIGNVRFATVTNDVFGEGKHYVTIIMLADYVAGEARLMEPDKCEIWEWFEWDKLPEPLFLPIQNLQKMGFRI